MVKIISLITLLIFLTLACDAQGVVKHGRAKKAVTPLIDKEYDYVGAFDSGLAQVRYHGKYGWVDSLHREVIPCIYDYARDFSNGISLVTLNEKHGFINRKGEIITPSIFDDINYASHGDVIVMGCSDNYYTATLNGKQGIIDKHGKIAIPAIYDRAIFLSDDICCLVLAGKNEITDLTSNKVIPLPDGYEFDLARFYQGDVYNSGRISEGILPVVKDALCGFADTSRKIVVACVYDAVTYFQNHIAAVKKSNKWGCVDLQGRIVSELAYDAPFSFFVDIPYAIVKKEKKYGVINNKGSLVIPCIYDALEIPSFQMNKHSQPDGGVLFAAENEGKWGVLDLKNKLTISCKYDEIMCIQDGVIYAVYMGKRGATDESGRIIIPFKYDEIRPFVNGMAVVEVAGSYGYCDSTGKEVIPCIYEDAYNYDGITAKVRGGVGYEKYIDKVGHTVRKYAKPNKYSYVGSFHCGLAIVKDENGYSGYINRKFKEVIPCIYEDAEYFVDTVARVYSENKWGYINAKGIIVKPFSDNQWQPGDRIVPVKIEGKWGYKDSSGAVVIDPVFDYASCFSDGLACINRNHKYGSIDTKGREVITPVYDHPYFFDSGLALVDSDHDYRFINKNGSAVISLSLDNAKPFSHGLAAAEKDGKWGYINRSGGTVIAFIYDNCASFHGGFAAVCKDDKWGYIDRNGKNVVALKYSSAGNFTHGLACVSLQSDSTFLTEKYGVIDKAGKIVIPFKYNGAMISYLEDNLSFVDSNCKAIFVTDCWGNVGMLDTQGKTLVPCKYQSISSFSEGLSAVEKDGKWGYVDEQGKEVIFFK